MTEKIKKLLSSGNIEDITLGLILCKKLDVPINEILPLLRTYDSGAYFFIYDGIVYRNLMIPERSFMETSTSVKKLLFMRFKEIVLD